MWPFILLVFALVLCILAALNVPSSRVSLGWAGMSFFVAYWLFARGLS